MKKTVRGMALVTILLVSAALLTIVSAGLGMGSSSVLMVSQAHQRNVALAAAEAGIFEAMLRLEQDHSFSGSDSGALTDSKASYDFEVENHLLTQGRAIVVSTGSIGGVRRTLRVTLEPDASSFPGIAVEGKVYIFDTAYVNAIASAANPLVRPGNTHSNYAGGDSFISKDFNQDGQTTRLRTTGELTAAGTFDPSLGTTEKSKTSGITKPLYHLDRSAMLAGSFTNISSPTAPSNTTLTTPTIVTNSRFSGDKKFPQRIHVAKGVTLHIQGKAEFLGGITGEGNVVVDGETIIRTDANFDHSLEGGLKLLSEESVFIVHPEAEVSSSNVDIPFSDVGDFFAQMPREAYSEIANGIPVGAPKGAAFFRWYANNAGSSSQDFQHWFTGDGSKIYPGLSQKTKNWLSLSTSKVSAIEAWAASH